MKTSKKIRGILLWLGIIAVSLWAIYVNLGSPALTPQMGMRRLERLYKVGPSKIIWEGETPHRWSDRLIQGETDYGYCFYLYASGSYGYGVDSLTYVEKGRERCFVSNRSSMTADSTVLPVFAINGNSRAVEARLTLETKSETEFYEGTYSSTAELTGGVFFQFAVDITDMDLTVKNYWEDRLNDDKRVGQFISGVMTLELFDRDGNLIDTIVTDYPASQ